MMNYKFRKNAAYGEWCSLLLPLCFLSNIIHTGLTYSNELYILLFTMSIWLYVFDLLKERVFKKEYNNYSNHIFYSLTSFPLSFFIWKFSTHYSCFFHAFAFCLVTNCCYVYLKTRLLKCCPGSFTLGEVNLIAKSIVLFFITYEFNFFRKINELVFSTFTEISSYIKCLQVLLIGCFFLIYVTHMLPFTRRERSFIILFLITSSLMLYTWSIYLNQNIFGWLLTFCLQYNKRIYLICYWVFLTSVSAFYVILINLTSVTRGSTIVRKVFHFIITAIYVPGILYDLDLMILASGIAFAAFLMLEMFRILKFPVIGTAIENTFQIFLDEKDTGILILTHIYLLIGCSCPLWLGLYNNSSHISHFSGIISVGIGDTFAAIFGKLFGRHKWKGTNKTVEGSFGALVIQVFCAIYLFHILNHSFTVFNTVVLISAVVSTTYLEARTDQVDNLILPLFMFSILSWIK